MFAQTDKFWVTFVVAGILKGVYDLGLLAQFGSVRENKDRGDKKSSVDND